MTVIDSKELYEWCKVPYSELENHPQRKIPFRLCQTSSEMGQIMARELVDEIEFHNREGEATRAIIPCGPSCWYEPFTELVNQEKVSLKTLHRLSYGRMSRLAGAGIATQPSLQLSRLYGETLLQLLSLLSWLLRRRTAAG